jgi:hypothetical protein
MQSPGNRPENIYVNFSGSEDKLTIPAEKRA